jgi:glucose/arabinose dehydrogenase
VQRVILRARFVLLAALVVTATFAVGALGSRQAGSAFGLRSVASGFDEPILLTSARSQPNVLYVVEQPGRVLRLAKGRRTVVLDLRRTVDTSGSERGLLGLAFHPRFPRDRRLYLAYTTRTQNVVVEFRTNAAGTAVLPATQRVLLAVNDPYGNHNGGHVVFGRDGFLYTTIGDGGSGGDPENRAQDPASPFGKLLRFDVNVRPARAETVALGLRNAWRFTFDRANGDLYIGDVGQGDVEEIDYTKNPSPGLENYEWDVREGSRPFESKPFGPGRRVGPVAEYDHDEGCSVTGGHVYRGKAVRTAVGRYFYGDYCSGTVWSFVIRNGRATGLRTEPGLRLAGLSSFGEGAGGELYLVSHQGTIYRMTG